MRKILALVVLLLSASAAKASEQTWVTIDSATWSSVGIASTTAVRIDNLILGVTGYALSGRSEIVLTLPRNAPAFNCNYYIGSSTSANQVSLSTQPGNAFLGAEYVGIATQALQIKVPCSTRQSYWCQGQGASTGTIHVDQTRPMGSMFGL